MAVGGYSAYLGGFPVSPHNSDFVRGVGRAQAEVGDGSRFLRGVVCGRVNLAHLGDSAGDDVHPRADALAVMRRRAVQRDLEPVAAVVRVISKQDGRGGGARPAVFPIFVCVGYEYVQIAVVVVVEQDDAPALSPVVRAGLGGGFDEIAAAQILE